MVPIHIKYNFRRWEKEHFNKCFLKFSKNWESIFNLITKQHKEAINVIKLNQIVKRYHTKDKDVLAVDHGDLNIESGSIFGVIGFSGAGKSTLIRMFNNLESPTSGEIIIDGNNISQLSKSQLRKNDKKWVWFFNILTCYGQEVYWKM